ncbi:MAG TPA: hypothetical protein VMD59_23420 [Acidimicrobiales bacterium]|nr:hypothetical protein [Acidimicrobiales bacterium]
MTVREQTAEQPVRPHAPGRSTPISALGAAARALRASRKRTTAFDRFADWVSEAMGKPANIVFWLVLVVSWTLVFAVGGPDMASGRWLPAWFTSQGFNFPLNLVTTIAELFIGFLVATAANRAQSSLTALLDQIDLQEQQIEATESYIVTLIKENTELTDEVHTLSVETAKNAALITEVHRLVSTLVAAGSADGSD